MRGYGGGGWGGGWGKGRGSGGMKGMFIQYRTNKKEKAKAYSIKKMSIGLNQ